MDQNSRRGFLRNLASLPLIGGGLTLIGSPTAAAVPVTPDLLDSYDAWLHFERRWLQFERFGAKGTERDKLADGWVFLNERTGRAYSDMVRCANGGGHYHGNVAPASTRAAVVLSAVGCGWEGL